MDKITIVSIRPPALNAKGDQLVLWNRLQALIEINIDVHLILYSNKNNKVCEKISSAPKIKITYLNHGLFDYIKSILFTAFTLYPLESRLFLNRKLDKIINHSINSNREILIFYTTRIWSSIKRTNGNILFAEFIDSYSLNYTRRPSVGIYKIYNNIQAYLHKRLEQKILNKVSKAFVVSQVDADWLRSENVSVIPNGVDSQPILSSENRKRHTIGFLGNLNYGPNKRAVKWFSTEVMPLIVDRRPDAKFIVAGNNSKKLRVTNSQNVIVIGRVPSQFQFFSNVSVAVAPMLDGAGIQNKILEAMSTGTPVVATSLASRPIISSTKFNMLIGDTKEALANHVLDLFDDCELSESVGKNGKHFVLENYSWNKINHLFLQKIGCKGFDNEKH